MDPRHTDTEDEQFLLNMIGEGQGDVAEQADDGSNTDIYLNMSGDGCEVPSGDDDAAADQDANVNMTTALLVFKLYLTLVSIWIIVAAEKRRSEARQRNWKGGTL